KLKNANVEDVYYVLRDLYQEQMNLNPTRGPAAFGPGAAIAAAAGVNRNVDSFGNPRAVTLSLSMDIHTNTLHVACPDSLFKDIGGGMKEIEECGTGSRGTVRIVRSEGVDPRQVQQAIDAIMGRPTNTQQNNGFGFGGGFNGGGFNGGGFNGGGFN